MQPIGGGLFYVTPNEQTTPLTSSVVTIATSYQAKAELAGFAGPVITIVTAGSYTGTVDIQGRDPRVSGAWQNVRYFQDTADNSRPVVDDQISLTTSTTTLYYRVMGYWPELRLTVQRTAGTGDISASWAALASGELGNITVDTELPAAAAPADAAANPTVPAVGTFPMVWNGTTWDRLLGFGGNAGIIYGRPTTARLSVASINFSATGDNTIVAGVAAQTIRVFKIFFIISAASNLTLKSGAGTSLTGAMNMPANGSLTLDFDADPWIVTAAADAFVINQSGTAQVSGRVYYTQS